MNCNKSFLFFIFFFSLFICIACQKQSSGFEFDLGNDAPLTEITPVAQLPLPSEVQKIPAESYAYDDLSVRTNIEFMGAHYGVSVPQPDAITRYLGRKYNADIIWSSGTDQDMETLITTRFAAGDIPDVIVLSTAYRRITQLLYDQGLVADAAIAMRYMPNYAQYFTQEYADFITYQGVYTAAPRYPIQGGWDNFIRKDWLEKLGMEMPKTPEELLTYARRVTREDPDGNGRNDTWFASGAGGGRHLGMLWGLVYYFGDPYFNVKDGRINYGYLDGTYKNFLAFVKTLQDEGLLAPDWYTIEWEAFKTYSMNGRIGLVNYPAPNLLQETISHMELTENPSDTSWDIWTPLPPLVTGRAQLSPGPSYMFVFPAKTLQDPVKFKRICHILDQSLFGGEDYLNTIEGGGNDVFEREVCIYRYNDNGSISFYFDPDTYPDANDPHGPPNEGWGKIGQAGPPYQIEFRPDNPYFNERLSQIISEQALFNRWPSFNSISLDYNLLVDLDQLSFVEEPRFILGGRNIEQWDDFVNEWLNRGGRRALTDAARQLNVADYQ